MKVNARDAAGRDDHTVITTRFIESVGVRFRFLWLR